MPVHRKVSMCSPCHQKMNSTVLVEIIILRLSHTSLENQIPFLQKLFKCELLTMKLLTLEFYASECFPLTYYPNDRKSRVVETLHAGFFLSALLSAFCCLCLFLVISCLVMAF